MQIPGSMSNIDLVINERVAVKSNGELNDFDIPIVGGFCNLPLTNELASVELTLTVKIFLDFFLDLIDLILILYTFFKNYLSSDSRQPS